MGVIHLTPTGTSVMPKEKVKGHRALRHPSFQGENDFCLVYLHSDRSHTIAYFQHVFKTGVEIAGVRYHLFGSSNSRMKTHSFWWVKAQSLDEIAEKRLQMGQLNSIENLGTYVARLGLWFSDSNSTGVDRLRPRHVNNHVKEF